MSDAAYWYRAGNDALRNGNDREAIDCYRKAIAMAPAAGDAWPAYSNMGAAYMGLSQYKEALDCLNKALRYNSRDASSLGNRAIARKELGDLRGALEDETAAIAEDRYNANHYLNRSQTKRRLGDYQGAVEDASQALVCGRLSEWHQGRIYAVRGAAKYLLQDWNGAMDDLNQALKIYPKDAFSNFWRGALCLKTGHIDVALEDYRYGIQFQGGSYGEKLRHIAPLLEQKQYQQAAKALREVGLEEETLLSLVEYLEQQAGG